MIQGSIPSGIIDPRSIEKVDYTKLNKYKQCHFFAGIGGWLEALRLAEWPEDRQVWTGSCPCQPYSTAGNMKGNNDERDLWSTFFNLIRKCRPDTIFGEQVPGAIAHGWLDRLQTDMEKEGYTVGHCVLGAHSVRAPHIRNRLYWMAYTNGTRYVPYSENKKRVNRQKTQTAFPYGWSDTITIRCEDNKYRRIPTESTFYPLAYGVPNKMVQLHGYGNAIVPQVAALFIKAFLEVEKESLTKE